MPEQKGQLDGRISMREPLPYHERQDLHGRKTRGLGLYLWVFVSPHFRLICLFLALPTVRLVWEPGRKAREALA
jgi:hypothetical protein